MPGLIRGWIPVTKVALQARPAANVSYTPEVGLPRDR